MKTYTASIIGLDGKFERFQYQGEPNGNLVGLLPIGAFPLRDKASTLERTDGGDPYEHALFGLESGRVVIIELDGQK